MTKAKSSDDFDRIISEQLDILASGKATSEDCKRADSIANMIGKQFKKDGLRLVYFEKQKKIPPRIDCFESDAKSIRRE
jgi:hypothetical protein